VRYTVLSNALLPEGSPMTAAGERGRTVVELPFRAGRIAAKTNLRIFDLDGFAGQTVKVQMISSIRRRPVVLRELHGRRLIEDGARQSGLGVPRIIDWDRRQHAWLIEEHVTGDHVTAGDVARFVRDHALALAGPARARPIGRRSTHRDYVEASIKDLRGMAPSLARIDADAAWLVGFCHNDHGGTNLLRGYDGKLWLIDWEHAGVGPVAVDLGQLYADFPDLAEPMLAVLRALDPRGAALAPERQLALGAMITVQRRFRARRALINEKVRQGQVAPARAEEKFRADLTLACQRIAALAG
jgi:hypothetical protein